MRSCAIQPCSIMHVSCNSDRSRLLTKLSFVERTCFLNTTKSADSFWSGLLPPPTIHCNWTHGMVWSRPTPMAAFNKQEGGILSVEVWCGGWSVEVWWAEWNLVWTLAWLCSHFRFNQEHLNWKHPASNQRVWFILLWIDSWWVIALINKLQFRPEAEQMDMSQKQRTISLEGTRHLLSSYHGARQQ